MRLTTLIVQSTEVDKFSYIKKSYLNTVMHLFPKCGRKAHNNSKSLAKCMQQASVNVLTNDRHY